MSDERIPDETPPLPGVKIPKPSGSWRLEVAAISQDIHYLSRWFHAQNAVPNPQALVDAIEAHLNSVRYYLSRRFGANPISILGHLEAAQAGLLRLAPLSYVHSCLPGFVVQARQALGPDDLRRVKLEDLAKKADLDEGERQVVIACLNGVGEQVRRAQSRLQSFRNVVVATAGFLLGVVCILGLVSIYRPTLLPICFVRSVGGQATVACASAESSPFIDLTAAGNIEPSTLRNVREVEEVVAVTAGPLDVIFVEFIGFVAAALAAAIAIRHIRGSSDPYSIPVALAFLKLPTGALTALLGLVLIRAGLVPGIKSLDSSAEIIAWALIFGYAQQLFTGVVDRQARSVLEQSGAGPRSPRTTDVPQ